MVFLREVSSPLVKILVSRLCGIVPHAGGYKVVVGRWGHRWLGHRGGVGPHMRGMSGVGWRIRVCVWVTRDRVHGRLRREMGSCLEGVRHGRLKSSDRWDCGLMVAVVRCELLSGLWWAPWIDR